MLRRSVVLPPQSHISAPILRGCGPWITSALVIVTVLSTNLSLAPWAFADPAANLTNAMASARSETSCGPLRYNPVVEQAAEVFNRLSDSYLNHTATRVPSGNVAPGAHVDPLPGLKDLGYRGTKAYLLQGAHKDEALAIKGLLLEGYAASAISDCSYTDFGANVWRNERTGYILASVVLAAA